jgi:CBS domain-containing protein
MTCSDLMTKNVATCYPEERANLAARLMRDRNVGALVVIGRNGHPAGFITDRDFAVGVCANAEDSYYKTVKEVMHSPAVCCQESDDLTQVCRTMTEHRIRRVPIVDGQGELVGIISADDLARSLDSEQVKSLFASLSTIATVNARGS